MTALNDPAWAQAPLALVDVPLIPRPWGGDALATLKGQAPSPEPLGESFEAAADPSDEEAGAHPSTVAHPRGDRARLTDLLASQDVAILGAEVLASEGLAERAHALGVDPPPEHEGLEHVVGDRVRRQFISRNFRDGHLGGAPRLDGFASPFTRQHRLGRTAHAFQHFRAEFEFALDVVVVLVGVVVMYPKPLSLSHVRQAAYLAEG